jgi:hypothetical protein
MLKISELVGFNYLIQLGLLVQLFSERSQRMTRSKYVQTASIGTAAYVRQRCVKLTQRVSRMLAVLMINAIHNKTEAFVTIYSKTQPRGRDFSAFSSPLGLIYYSDSRI